MIQTTTCVVPAAWCSALICGATTDVQTQSEIDAFLAKNEELDRAVSMDAPFFGDFEDTRGDVSQVTFLVKKGAK
jgi:hypothetical protein